MAIFIRTAGITHIGAKASGVIFQSGERANEEYSMSGTLSGWQNEIAAYAVNNPLLAFTLSGAFAGTLLNKCNAESGGFHYVADSSSGKTGLIEAACSVWGGDNYKRSWRSTANGMEGVPAPYEKQPMLNYNMNCEQTLAALDEAKLSLGRIKARRETVTGEDIGGFLLSAGAPSYGGMIAQKEAEDRMNLLEGAAMQRHCTDK